MLGFEGDISDEEWQLSRRRRRAHARNAAVRGAGGGRCCRGDDRWCPPLRQSAARHPTRLLYERPNARHLRTQVCLKHDLHHTSPETVSAHSLTPTGFFLGGFTRPEIAVDRSDTNTSSVPTVPADIHSPYEIRRSRTGQRFYVFISVTYLLFVGAVRSASARADVCFITRDLGSLRADVTTSAYALSLLCSCVVTI
ncbi:unnamed protein product [Danaus chrysippus]|uniref:(African queen) hypothetical protein n=1 Tax=Danaus chrysippus TaxID=151541 RepID=A0A8J2QQN4_9NEOP|nr:unnamed protein product [Danaus chrysippus]